MQRHSGSRRFSSAHVTFRRGRRRRGRWRGAGFLQPHRPAVPFLQRKLCDLRRLSRHPRLAQAQGAEERAARSAGVRHQHRLADRERPHRSRVGRFFRLLHGHRRAQMGPSLPEPEILLADRRAHGGRRSAGDGEAGRPLHRGRNQLHRLGHAVRAQLGLHRGPPVPAFRGMLPSGRSTSRSRRV